MLLSSTGGLLFVFNRNLSFLLFSLFIICSFFLLSKGLKSKNFYSSLLAFCTVIALFIINFFIAEVQPQSLTKYSFFGVIFFTTTLSLLYFNNQENKNALIDSLYFILKLIHYVFQKNWYVFPQYSNKNYRGQCLH